MLLLRPRGNTEYELDFTSEYRGVFQVGAKHLLVYDPLGLFRLKIKGPVRSTLTVLPNIYVLPNLPVELHAPLDVSYPGGQTTEEYSDFPDFKKYLPEDGYKRIHWQLSAQHGELISKNYFASSKAATAVIINNARLADNMKPIGKMRCGDNLIEAAVSVTAYCNSLAMPVYLDYIGGTRGPASLDFSALYAAASGIEFNADENFDDFLAETMEARRDAVNIFIFTHTNCAQNIWSYNKNSMVFYLSDEINIVEAIERKINET